MSVNAQRNVTPIRILIAEDQETDAFFIEKAFEQSKMDNIVYLVKDGQEALDFLDQTGKHADSPRPDIIFLDIKMPRKDGHETLTEIKLNEKHADIPVIIMSGSQAVEDVVKAYASRANAYVSKSNGFNEMLEFVDAVEKFWFTRARLPQRREA